MYKSYVQAPQSSPPVGQAAAPMSALPSMAAAVAAAMVVAVELPAPAANGGGGRAGVCCRVPDCTLELAKVYNQVRYGSCHILCT